MEKDPVNRLGSVNGLEDVLKHPFLASIDFEKLVNKELEPPFKPKLSDDVLDVSNFDQ